MSEQKRREFWKGSASVGIVLIIIVLVGIFLCGCAAQQATRADSLHYWTRYYEVRMGLPQIEIVFESDPTNKERCGWITADPGLTIHYDLDQTNCRPPWTLAKHETCHARWQHPYMVRDFGPQMEAEAEDCVARYYK